MRPRGECLPVNQVLDTVLRVERDVAGFYESARELANDDEVKHVFDTLLREKKENQPVIEKVCQEIQCGDSALEGASQEDLNFLSALAETAFYRRAGNPAELADPMLQVNHLVDNALKLEKDLMLFYMRFFGVSCQAHRPVFSKLIQTSQRHVGELNNVKTRLAREY